MSTPKKRLAVMITVILILLLVPFIAMQFTNEVKWSAGDFGLAAGLLLGAGLLSEWVMRVIKKRRYRVLLIGFILLLLVLVWLELAVGIFGTPVAGT